MRKKLEPKFEKHRFQKPGYTRTDSSWGVTGFFMLPFKDQSGKVVSYLHVMSSEGSEEHPWEHVSITVNGTPRCPFWEEMCFIKSVFWTEEESAVQFHPPVSDHVNFHPYCLHLWRPWGGTFPQPSSILVGPKAEDPSQYVDKAKLNAEAGKVIDAYVQARRQDGSIDYLRS